MWEWQAAAGPAHEAAAGWGGAAALEPAAAAWEQHPPHARGVHWQQPHPGVLLQTNQRLHQVEGWQGATPCQQNPFWACCTPAQGRAAQDAAAAAAAAALSECRRLNSRLRRAGSAEELFSALAEGWRSLDCINLSAALNCMAQLAEASAEGPEGFRRRHLQGDARWGWLLDQVPAAAASPGFGPQCVSNSLAALCKLDALCPSLLHALHAPLRCALSSPAAEDRLTAKGLTQVLWAVGRDVDSLKALVLGLREPLYEALWLAAPTMDAQGVATAWWALGEMSSRCPLEELHLAAEAPDLFPRLASAAKAAAAGGGLSFQGLAQVLHACAKMRPHLFRDEPLLHTLAAAAARKLQTSEEQPSPQAAGLIACSLGRLAFQPRCHWCPRRGVHTNLLDDLGAALAARLPAARPQDVANFMSGLGQLKYAPPAAVLSALLAHLAGSSAEGGQPANGAAEAAGPAGARAGQGPAPAGPPGSAGGTAPRQLVLQQYSSQQIADLVSALRSMLGAGRPYTEALLPPAVVEAFFDALDTVLAARASLSTRLSPPERADLALTGQHVGAIMSALGRLAAVWPCAALTDTTLIELERHVLAHHYSGSSLASFLHYYALAGCQPGPEAVDAACQRALAILHNRERPLQLQQAGQGQGFTLGALAKLVGTLGALQVDRPRLLCALLPAAAEALAALQQAPREQLAGTCRELVSLAAGLGQLQAAGLLLPAVMESLEGLLPLWHDLMRLLDAAVYASGPSQLLRRDDAALVQSAAAELNDSAPDGGFWLPPAVTGALPPPALRARGHPT